MIDHPNDAYRRKLQQRIVELRTRLEEITEGDFMLGGMAEGMTPEAEIAFLEQVIACELAPSITWRAKLREAGYEMPDPTTLTEAEIGLEVWQVIQRLSELRAYLSNTNHLSDRELYEHLYDTLLSAETDDIPLSEDSACHFDLIGSGSEEDIDHWLRYYADPEERQHWQADDPGEPLPPHEDPPYHRDHLLPVRTHPDAPLHRFLERLLASEWNDPLAPIHLATDLTHEEVAGTHMHIAARALLEALQAAGKVKATATLGNLPRAFVKKVYPRLPFTPREREFLEFLNKVFDEQDVMFLHQVRMICQYAGLLRKYKGHFVLTRKGTSLLDPARAGELYRALFLAQFRKANLAYFDGCRDLPGIQQTVAVILWRLAIVAGDWTPADVLQQQTLLPEVLDELEQAYSPQQAVGLRLWRHLYRFGLLEPDRIPDGSLADIGAYRITPLFSRFLAFDPIEKS